MDAGGTGNMAMGNIDVDSWTSFFGGNAGDRGDVGCDAAFQLTGPNAIPEPASAD